MTGRRYSALVLSALASCAVLYACGSSSDDGLFEPAAGGNGSGDGGTTGADASTSGGSSGSAGATGGRSSTGGASNTGGRSATGGASGAAGMPGGAPGAGGGDAAASAGGSISDGSVGAGGGGPSADAGTPGVIECAGTPCEIPGLPTNICCYGGLTTSCLPSFPGCANFGSPIACDDRADCEGGQVCCGGLPLGFGCVASCTSGTQLCRTDDECASGHCQPLMNAPAYSACM